MRYILILMIMIYTSISVARPLEPHEVPKEIYLDRSGLPELVIQNTFYGAAEGWLLGTAFFDDPVRLSSLVILGTASGILLPFYLNKNEPVHTSQAIFYNLAERWGLYNGFLIPFTFKADEEEIYSGSMGLLSLGALVSSIYLYPNISLTPGQASAFGSGIQFGLATGGLALFLTADAWKDSNSMNSIVGGTLLLSSNLGLALAYSNRDLFDIDRRRILWIDTGGLLGALGGLGVGFLLVGDNNGSYNNEVFALTIFAGMVGGIYSGYVLSDTLDEYKHESELKEFSRNGYLIEPPSLSIFPVIADTQGSAQVAYGFDVIRGKW